MQDDNKSSAAKSHMTARSQERDFSIIGYKKFSHGCIRALLVAYTMIIYLSNKIKFGLYRIYSTSMLKVNSQKSGYFCLQCYM